jgi:hypothetical protein
MADPISEPTIVPISPAVAEAMSEGVHKDEEAPSAGEQDSPGSKASRDAAAAQVAPRQPDAQPQDGQQTFTLRDNQVRNRMVVGFHNTDLCCRTGKYAIYRW